MFDMDYLKERLQKTQEEEAFIPIPQRRKLRLREERSFSKAWTGNGRTRIETWSPISKAHALNHLISSINPPFYPLAKHPFLSIVPCRLALT
jgi:hypothetical protein